MNTIANIFKSMQEDAHLAMTYTNSYWQTARRRFYEATSKPMALKAVVTDDTLRSLIVEAVQDLLRVHFAHSKFELEVSNIDSKTCQFNIKIKGWFRFRHDKTTFDQAKWEYSTPRRVKLSSLYAKAISPAREKFISKFNLENRVDRRYITQVENDVLKSFSVKAKRRDLWLYFTKYNVAKHYLTMKSECRLHSCMAYSANEYGNFYRSVAVHPLECYQHAPDFRLALVSYLSPDEIKNTEDYPFIGRVIVFRGDNDPLAFAKFYGDEGAEVTVADNLETIAHPEGREFYALLCDEVDLTHSVEDASEQLRSYYLRGQREGHLIAPFFDKWNNAFEFVDNTVKDIGDGRKGMLMSLVTPVTNEDEDGYNKAVLSIDTDTAVVVYTQNDGNIESTFAQKNGRFINGDERITEMKE